VTVVAVTPGALALFWAEDEVPEGEVPEDELPAGELGVVVEVVALGELLPHAVSRAAVAAKTTADCRNLRFTWPSPLVPSSLNSTTTEVRTGPTEVGVKTRR
jgi:hypothetical protein